MHTEKDAKCVRNWAKPADLHKKYAAVPGGLSVKSNTSLPEEAVGSECVEKGNGAQEKGSCFLIQRYLLPWKPNIVKSLPVSLYQKDRIVTVSDQQCAWPNLYDGQL